MSKTFILHNNRCTKSRQSKTWMDENVTNFEVINYLEDIPTEKELTEILEKLEMKPEEILRKGEAIYKEQYKGKNLSDKEWIKAMIEHPKLIERPIVVHGNKAAIGRPLKNVIALFQK